MDSRDCCFRDIDIWRFFNSREDQGSAGGRGGEGMEAGIVPRVHTICKFLIFLFFHDRVGHREHPNKKFTRRRARGRQGAGGGNGGRRNGGVHRVHTMSFFCFMLESVIYII